MWTQGQGTLESTIKNLHQCFNSHFYVERVYRKLVLLQMGTF